MNEDEFRNDLDGEETASDEDKDLDEDLDPEELATDEDDLDSTGL